MRETLTAHLADLAATLNDLRHRLRSVVREADASPARSSTQPRCPVGPRAGR